jgi:hypothetical protein
MDVFALVMWLVVASIAMPLGLLSARHLPLFVLQALAVGGAVTAWLLFIIVGEPVWLGWVGMAFWAMAVAALGLGAIIVIGDSPAVTAEGGSWSDEAAAGLAGIEWPFLLLAGVIAIFPALNIGTVA